MVHLGPHLSHIPTTCMQWTDAADGGCGADWTLHPLPHNSSNVGGSLQARYDITPVLVITRRVPVEGKIINVHDVF